MYSLSEFSKITGLSQDTLRNYDYILQPYRTPGGHRRYTDDHLKKLFRIKNQIQDSDIETIIYARVSTKSQLKDLERQVESLKQYSVSRGFKIHQIITDVGSSVNFKRSGSQKLLKVLLVSKPKYLIIASKDRLSRIGFEIFEVLCNLIGTELIIVYDLQNENQVDDSKQIVEELVHIIHLYTMKLYGKRTYKKLKQFEKEVLDDIKSTKTNKSNQSKKSKTKRIFD